MRRGEGLYVIQYEHRSLVIRENGRRYEIDLPERLFHFAVETLKFLLSLPCCKEFEVFRYQLSRCATSMGANYQEAQGAVSRKEFAAKIGICLKEARETSYFFRLLHTLAIGNRTKCNHLLREAGELQRIFAAILIKVKGKR